ncbi:hypothetical protein [Methanobrevibacter sp.]|uniref:hypothetical protein n=1 Tax=Methanobrevibacter sp. TaxID=66852 RepID=UPI00388E919E
MMDNNGNFTLEILVVGMIIILILGIISVASEISQEKISKSVENNNIEKTISEVADSLINDPGMPINWEDFKSKRVGLAIINEDETVIPNSVSYFKLLELGRDYENLVTKRIFNNKFDSSMELTPYETSISSVKIGSNNVQSNNVFSVNRVVKCDFFKKYVICDFLNDGKCNHNHNQKDHSCNYFKVFKGNLKKTDYYLLLNDNEKLENKYSIDTTHFKSYNSKSISNTKIYLNNELNGLFEANETSSVVFIHFDKKDTKAVLVGVPKDFDKSKLKYNYFTTQTCDFVIKAWS